VKLNGAPLELLVFQVTLIFADSGIMMMMIVFITINSSLVPLIEGLRRSIHMDSSSGCYVHIFDYFFSEGKICYKKKQTVQDFIQSPRTYVHIFT